MRASTLIWLIAGCLMLQPLSTDLYLSSLPHLATYFAATPAAVQQTLSMFVIGFGAAQLVAGPLSDRYGRRPVLMGGLATYLAASLACGLAPTLPLLVFSRFLQAAGACTGVVVARAIVRDVYTPAQGARALAKAQSLLTLVPIFGPVLGSYLQVALGWRAAFGAQAAFCALLAWAIWSKLEETNAQKNPEATRVRGLLAAYALVLKTPAFWAYTLPASLSYSALFAFLAGASFVLIRVLGVATENYGYCHAFAVVGYLSGTLICRHLLGRIGIKRTFAVGMNLSLFSAVFFVGLALAGVSHWLLVVLAMFLTMCSQGINFACAQAGAIAPFPKQAGTAAGMVGAITMLAAWPAGAIVGASFDGTLLPLALVSGGASTLAFVTAVMLRRYRS